MRLNVKIIVFAAFFVIADKSFSFCGLAQPGFMNLTSLINMPLGFFGIFNQDAQFKKKYSALLSDPDWKKRYQSVKAIGLEKNDLKFSYLINSLSDNNVAVSLEAFRQLNKSGKTKVLPYLIKGLDSRDPWTRKLCIELLSDYKTPEVSRQLVFMANDSNRDVKLAAITALEKISGETLLFEYFPQADREEPSGNILNWWYMRGKIIKQSDKDR